MANADDAVLVQSVVTLGHDLGLTIVAEGVEDQPTLDALIDAGCDIAQGFHLGRPMPEDALDAWLEARAETHGGPRRIPDSTLAGP